MDVFDTTATTATMARDFVMLRMIVLYILERRVTQQCRNLLSLLAIRVLHIVSYYANISQFMSITRLTHVDLLTFVFNVVNVNQEKNTKT